MFAIDGSLVTQPAQEAYHFGFASLQLDYQHAGGLIYQDASLSTSPGSSGNFSAIDSDLPAPGRSPPDRSAAPASSIRCFIRIAFARRGSSASACSRRRSAKAPSNFLSTARIADVEFYDASMLRLSDVTLLGASGTAYVGATAPVPEPETWALMAAGLATLGWLRRRRA